MKVLLLLFPLLLSQVAELTEQPQIKKADIVPRAFVNPSNSRRMRVVGCHTQSTTVSNTPLGEVVEIYLLSSDAICPVVFSAAPDEAKKKPIVAGIEWKMMTPIVVNRAEEPWIWWTILNREECLVMAEYPDYIGSTLDEFLNLPMPLRRRILKTYGTCTTEEEGKTIEFRCVVPIGDKKAIQGADVFFPHNLAGRKDINFKRYSNGKIQPRNPAAAYEALSKDK